MWDKEGGLCTGGQVGPQRGEQAGGCQLGQDEGPRCCFFLFMSATTRTREPATAKGCLLVDVVWTAQGHAFALMLKGFLLTGGQGHADVAVTCLPPLDEGHIRPPPAAAAEGASPAVGQRHKPRPTAAGRVLDAFAKAARGVHLAWPQRRMYACGEHLT